MSRRSSQSAIGKANVTRQDGATFTVDWESSGTPTSVSVYPSTDPGAYADDHHGARVAGVTRTTISALDPTVRHYFHLVPDGGPRVVVSERLVPLAGTRNCRDLGGYPAAGGRHVKWGKLYRSDDLAGLTDADHAYLASLAVKLVCDLRGADEIGAQPDRLPPGQSIKYLHVPVSHESFAPNVLRERIIAGQMDALDEEYMIGTYRLMLDDFASSFGIILRRLAEPDSLPTIIHCAGGKDRTGLAAALVLLALGVPEDVVVRDYELTEVYMGNWAAEIRERLTALFSTQSPPAVLTASPAFMQAAIRHITDTYGSVGTYLRRQVGVDDATIERLRNALLEGGGQGTDR